jgi:siroheme synthase
MDEQVESPSLIIVGEVVALKERLAWFAGQQRNL